MTPDPQFFILEGRADNKYPTAFVDRTIYTALRCVACSRPVQTKIERHQYELICELGSAWPDIMESTNLAGRPLFSERVVDALRASGVAVEVHPTHIDLLRSKKLRKSDAPKYFVPLLKSGIRIDLEASGERRRSDPPRGPELCPVCGFRENLPGPRTKAWQAHKRRGLHVVPGSWAGLDLFISEDLEPVLQVFCTRKVLELARRERWTGARFEPIDAPFDLTNRSHVWKGIPYLGKQWPPKAWYPPPPDAGKSPEEWVQQLVSGVEQLPPARSGYKTPQADVAGAFHALLWIGAPAIPLLEPLLYHVNQNLRKDAAWLIQQAAERDEVTLDQDMTTVISRINAEPLVGDSLSPERYQGEIDRRESPPE
ncbi:MAG TPA: hypothetical protein VD997_04230 [Phycisphaerales bacterium]|nr:hypothetical protein [Phycisphaerales bacterium]